MISNTRRDCELAVVKFATRLLESKEKLNSLLYVGIAGDPQGGEYSKLFPTSKVITLDADPVWNPDVVGDITKTDFADESFEMVVCVQVIEHIKNLWDLPRELYRIIKPEGYCIIDCPWMYPYHAEPPSFGDFWRVSKDGMVELFKNFALIDMVATEHNTSCLLKKK